MRKRGELVPRWICAGAIGLAGVTQAAFPVHAQYHNGAPKLAAVPPELRFVWHHQGGKLNIKAGIHKGLVEFYPKGNKSPLIVATWKNRQLHGYLKTRFPKFARDLCPKWGKPRWSPLRLTLSADGTRLAGKYYRTNIFSRHPDPKKLCTVRWKRWTPVAFKRLTPPHGWLRVVATAPGILAPAKIGLVLDASGSMRGKLPDGSRKIDVAKRVMRAVVGRLPTGVEVGLRVYGHRLKSRPKKLSCADTQLVVPFARGNRAQLIAAIDRLRPQGQTPIGLSLSKLAADFGAGAGFRLVVLVSDGIETCAPMPADRYNPLAVIRRLKTQGVRLRVNVVGFDVGQGATQRFLRRIAKDSGGGFYGAGNAQQLDTALQKAFATSFQVANTAGKAIARGAVGGPPLKLRAGVYRITIRGAVILTASAAIQGNRQTILSVIRRNGRAVVERQVQ